MRVIGRLVTIGVVAAVGAGVWWWVAWRKTTPAEGVVVGGSVVGAETVRGEERADTVEGRITWTGEGMWWVEFVVRSRIGGELFSVEIAADADESQSLVVISGTPVGGSDAIGPTRAAIRRWRRRGSGETIVVATPICEPLAVSVGESGRVGGGAEVRREVVVDYNQVVPLAVLALGDVDSQVTTTEAPNVLADAGIQFEFDDDSVRGDRVDMVRQLSRLLNQRRELVIWVEGHTDSIGDAVYNRSLGMRRAEAVSQVLFQEGIDSSRIVLSSAGEGQSRGSDLRSDRRAELLIRPCPVEEEDGGDGIAGEVANDDGEMMGSEPSEAATGQAIEFLRATFELKGPPGENP